MKRNIKLALAELEQEMEIIQKQDLEKYKGGYNSPNPSANDCVFQTLAYLSSGTLTVSCLETDYNEKFGCNRGSGDCSENGFLIQDSDVRFKKLVDFVDDYFTVGHFNNDAEASEAGYKAIYVIDSNKDGTADHVVANSDYLYGIISSTGDTIYHDPQQSSSTGVSFNSYVEPKHLKKTIYVKIKKNI